MKYDVKTVVGNMEIVANVTKLLKEGYDIAGTLSLAAQPIVFMRKRLDDQGTVGTQAEGIERLKEQERSEQVIATVNNFDQIMKETVTAMENGQHSNTSAANQYVQRQLNVSDHEAHQILTLYWNGEIIDAFKLYKSIKDV